MFDSGRGKRLFLILKASGVAEAHILSCAACTRVSLSGVHQQCCDGDHTSPSSAEIKNDWIYTSTPYMPLWHAEELCYLYLYLTAFFKLFKC